MPEHGRFSHRLDIWMNDDLYGRLYAEANRRGLSVANLVRDLLSQALAEQAALEARDALDRAIRRAIKPDVERLAALIVKAATAAATSMYLNTQALADLGQHNAVELYQEARKKAVTYVRSKDEDDYEQ